MGSFLQDNAVEIISQEMVTDMQSSFGNSFLDLSGYSMAKRAAENCFRKTGLNPTDVDVLEVHDCFSCNEVSNNRYSFCKQSPIQ